MMQTTSSYAAGRYIQAESCSNFEVLQRACTGAADVLGPAAFLQSPCENASWFGGPNNFGREQGDISFRNKFIGSGIENALLQSGTSLAMDLVLCYASKTGDLVRVEENFTLRNFSLLEGLVEDVVKMQPKKRGQRLFVTATSVFRSKDSRAVEDQNGGEWSIITDDSFQSISLVPGEESTLIGIVAIIGGINRDDAVYKELEELSIVVKKRLLIATNPVSYDPDLIDWHTYKQIGLLLIDVRKMEQLLGHARVQFSTKEDKVVLILNPSSKEQKYLSQFPEKGFIKNICRALMGHDLAKGQRFEASIAALQVMDHSGQFAAWNVLMAVRTVLEAADCGSYLSSDALMYSRTLNDFITEYDENDVEALATFMTISSSEKEFLLRKTVHIGDNVFDLNEVGARNEEGHDHDKIGNLGRPKLRRRCKIQGVNVRGGRGIPVMSAAAFISYRLRGKRYRLTVADGKVQFSNRSDLLEDLNIFRKIKLGKFGPTGVTIEKEVREHDEGVVDNHIINSLLHGQHGIRLARWVWALILFGSIAVDQESVLLSYVLGSDLNIDEDKGYKIRTLMTSECLTRAVMYTDEKRLWVDVLDNLKLREVTKNSSTCTLCISESVTPLDEIDVESLWECSITSKTVLG